MVYDYEIFEIENNKKKNNNIIKYETNNLVFSVLYLIIIICI